MKDGTMIFFARKHDCEACALKPKCCPNMPARKIPRSVHEAAHDKARAITKTEAYAISPRERRRSRCCLRISSASSGSASCASEDPAERRTSSYWPPPPKTSEKLAKVISLPPPAFAA
jgi:hypothetical protein